MFRTFKIFSPLLLALSISTAFASDSLKLEDLKVDINEKYTVKKGDTLWDISEAFFKDPFLWVKIWESNKQIENPHLIMPNDIIYFVKDKDNDEEIVIKIESKFDKVKLKEEKVAPTLVITPTKRFEKLEKPIPIVDFKKLNKITQETTVMNKVEFETKPYILAAETNEILLTFGDIVYTRNFEVKSQYYGIYKNSGEIVNSGKYYGDQIDKIGILRFLESNGDVTKFKVVSVKGEISVGDKLIDDRSFRISDDVQLTFPDENLEVNILRIVAGVNSAGLYDSLILDKGKNDLAVGSILSINNKGKVVKDKFTKELIQLPNEEYGQLIVTSVQDETSVAVVIKTKEKIEINDLILSAK